MHNLKEITLKKMGLSGTFLENRRHKCKWEPAELAGAKSENNPNDTPEVKGGLTLGCGC